MEILRSEALQAARNERLQAEHLRSAATEKDKKATQLHKKAKRDKIQSGVLRMAGPVGTIVGPYRFYGGSKLEKQADELEKEAARLRSEAQQAEKRALEWDGKAKRAE